MKLDELIAANYHPDFPEFNNLVEYRVQALSIEELHKGKTITANFFPIPANFDGSVSVKIIGDKLILKLNTDFVENFEKQFHE